MRLSLALSVSLNLLLLTTIVAARIDPERSAADRQRIDAAVFETAAGGSAALDGAAAAGTAAFGSAAAAGSRAAGIEDLIAILARAPLQADDLKPLVLGWLDATYRVSFEPRGPDYWQRGYSPGRDSLAAELAVQQAVRGALLDLFGSAAAGDPAFAAVFRPLGPAYAFLGSASQVALRHGQLDRLSTPVNLGVGQPTGASRCGRQPAGSGRFGADTLREWGLSEQEDAEYRLRFSPLADQLRDAGVARDENEFRELYGLLEALEQSPTPTGQAAARADLRARIGDEPFARFWSVRDPLFAPIEQYLNGQGVARHEVLAAYSIVNRSQEALLETFGRQTDDRSKMAAIRKIRDEQASRLTALLGTDAADGVVAAMNTVALRLSQGLAAGC
jgi:hypothetical protein